MITTNRRVSRIQLGRLLFGLGVLASVAYLIYVQCFPEVEAWRGPLIPGAGGAMALIGMLVLFRSRREASAEYREMERQEALRNQARAQAEAKRMTLGDWGNWDAFTQIRRPRPGLLEFRQSQPWCMLAGLGVMGSALDAAFAGILLPRLGILPGALATAGGAAVFMLGRGIVIDRAQRKVLRWWGWILKPLFWSEAAPETFAALAITKWLGPASGKSNRGRTVRYPLHLVAKNGRRILLKSCPRIMEARSLAEEISTSLALSIEDNSGAPPNEKTPPRRIITETRPASGMSLGPKERENHIQEHIIELAEDLFPDNTGLQWRIHGFDHDDDLTYVEVEPVPPEAGYARFKLAVSSDAAGRIAVEASYCLDQGVYTLLMTAPGIGRAFPRVLKRDGSSGRSSA